MASERFRIVWAPIAVSDLDEILDYISAQSSVTAAIRVYERVMDRANSLETLPQRGRIVPELRELGVTEYREVITPPYRIFYRISRRTVRILGILDARRDLGEILLNRALGTDLPR